MEVHGTLLPEYETIVTAEALQFITKLIRGFGERREELYTATRHQWEVGTGYFDQVAEVISGGTSSTTALNGSTEQEQFVTEGGNPHGRLLSL